MSAGCLVITGDQVDDISTTGVMTDDGNFLTALRSAPTGAAGLLDCCWTRRSIGRFSLISHCNYLTALRSEPTGAAGLLDSYRSLSLTTALWSVPTGAAGSVS